MTRIIGSAKWKSRMLGYGRRPGEARQHSAMRAGSLRAEERANLPNPFDILSSNA